MNIQEQIMAYESFNDQERKDKENLIQYISLFPDLYSRENSIAHFTSSSWIVNQDRSKVLMAYHKIMDAWAWTGGHADGEEDLYAVAKKEAREETGIQTLLPIKDGIFSLEILTVDGHYKRGEYVSSHLHLNVTYLFEAKEEEALRMKEDENSGVKWFPIEEAPLLAPNESDRQLYLKLNEKLKYL